MASFTLPNIVSGGSITVQGNSLADAQQNAASATGVSLAAQQGGGTFGINTNPNIGGTNPGAASPGPAPSTVNANNAAIQQLGSQVNSLLGAIASGNKEAFNEAVRQFDVSFGLDKDKFAEAVRQFNQNYLIAESGVTGTYQGQQTQQAQLQAANMAAQVAGITGYYSPPGVTPGAVPGMGVPTLAAQAQFGQLYGQNAAPSAGQQTLAAIAQRQQEAQQWAQLYGYAPQTDAAGNPILPTGQTLAANQQQYAQQLGAITTAAGLQANPFRQAQVMGQLGGVLRGTGVAGFQAPGQAQGQTDFSGMGNMQRLIDDIRGGPGAINSQSTQGVLDAMPTPAKLDSVNFYRSSPGTQNIVLQGMQEKYGLSPDESLAQIKNTLPQFQSPTTFGGVKR